MLRGAPEAPAHCRVLLRVLRAPQSVRHLGPMEWDLLIRVARRARLHGVLHARLEAAALLDAGPDRALAHLESGAAVARHRRQMARLEQHHVAQTLQGFGAPLVLLKGAAYTTQGLAELRGRPFNDLDVMVPAEHIAAMEAALRAAGWRTEVSDPYDDRYYREWSHELPPLRGPGRGLDVDLHHAIVPPTSRVRPDTPRLFADAVPLPQSPFLVLAPADQVLHAAVHLMHDVDAAERLRDLVDIDALLRAFGAAPEFWTALREHAAHHDLRRPLWYVLRYTHAWLDTPLPDDFARAVSAWGPSLPVRAAMDALLPATLFPLHPDRGARWSREMAWQLLRLRAMWLRMPLPMLLRHGATKLMRRFGAARPAGSAA
jgi:hypothetical protein